MTMTNPEIPEILELIDHFAQSSLQTMKLSLPGFSLELDRGSGGKAGNKAGSEAGMIQTASEPADMRSRKSESGAANIKSEVEPELPSINAPLVGTFYASPGPEQAPFVSVGTRIKKGQTVCLIEAMKMMSEVPAPCDGVITEVLKADGQLAAFGEPLFRYRAME